MLITAAKEDGALFVGFEGFCGFRSGTFAGFRSSYITPITGSAA